MRLHFIVAVVLASVTSSAYAQSNLDSMTVLQTAVACAMPAALAPIRPVAGPRVVGAQDTGFRTLTAQGDLLVIDSGLRAGIELDQRFFVRRPVTLGGRVAGSEHAISTAAWIRITAVNDIMAIATVEHSCSAIEKGDYLEPFLIPTVPEGADRTDTSGELDFTYSGLGRLMFGKEESRTAATGDLMLADRGSDQGVVAGARFAVYRDAVTDRNSELAVRPPGLPLAAIGEAIVISTGKAISVVRITAARGNVRMGDYLVPRKP
jgi:hypothetical protein